MNSLMFGFLPGVFFLAYLVALVYGIVLATRFVSAVEKIADRVGPARP